MMLSLDFVGRRYGMLPSKILLEASSLDMIIADAAQGYESHLREEHEKQSQAGVPGGLRPAPKLTTEQMQSMLNQVRQTQVSARGQ